MAYKARIEKTSGAWLITTVLKNHERWLINNPLLERTMLGFIAKYQEKYDVELYGVTFQGSHYHILCKFSERNRAGFMRDVNAAIARSILRYVDAYPGGRPTARRYDDKYAAGDEDVTKAFLYVALQPVKDGLVERLEEYPGYNCFQDAINERDRSYGLVNWKKYNEAKRYNEDADPEDFLEYHTLKFSRLPAFKDFSKENYIKAMKKACEEERVGYIGKVTDAKRKFVGAAALKRIKPGTPTLGVMRVKQRYKTEIRCECKNKFDQVNNLFASQYKEYEECSKAYRAGNLNVVFPEGMYKPYLYISACPS